MDGWDFLAGGLVSVTVFVAVMRVLGPLPPEPEAPVFHPVPGPLGLIWVDPRHARGIWRWFRLELTARPDHYELSLSGPLPERGRCKVLAAELRRAAVAWHRIGPDPRLWRVCGEPAVGFVVANALDALRDGVLRVDVPPEVDLAEVMEVVGWATDGLGWVDLDQAWDTALTDPSARVRRQAWESRFGWTPMTWPEDEQERLRLALRDPDPWVRGLGALHLGSEGREILLRLLRDPGTSDPLALEIARRVDPTWLTSADWVALLARQPAEVHVATREELIERAEQALIERAEVEILPSLVELARERSLRGRAARRIARRIAAEAGMAGSLALARSPGELALAEPTASSRPSSG